MAHTAQTLAQVREMKMQKLNQESKSWGLDAAGLKTIQELCETFVTATEDALKDGLSTPALCKTLDIQNQVLDSIKVEVERSFQAARSCTFIRAWMEQEADPELIASIRPEQMAAGNSPENPS
jgi:hypothetical protein